MASSSETSADQHQSLDDVREVACAALTAVPCQVFPRPPSGNVLCVTSDTTIAEGVKLLSDRGFLSAPVIKAGVDASAPWHEKYLGIFDVVGAGHLLLRTLRPEKEEITDEVADKNLLKIMMKEHVFMKKTVGDVIGSGRCCAFVPLPPHGTLLDAMIIMTKYKVHRVPIVEDDGDIVNLITQTAIINMMLENMEHFGDIVNRSLKDLGLSGQQNIVKANMSMTAAEAFQLFISQGISGVPIVGEHGCIVATLSSHDIRRLFYESKLYHHLHSPLYHFLGETANDARSVDIRNPAITCKPTDTLKQVLEKLQTTKIHRVFMVDEDDEPTRVVTLTDIISSVVKIPAGWKSGFTIDGVGLHDM